MMLGKLTPRWWLSNVPLVLAVLVLCGHVSCDCPLPERPFRGGTVTTEDDVNIENATVADLLTILDFTCSKGYLLVGDPLIQCMDGGWTSEFPYCANIQCSRPPSVEDASFVFEQGNASEPLVGSVVRYSCGPGYELFHPNASSLTCSPDRQTLKTVWDGELPYCIEKKDCKDPGTSPHGERFGECCSPGSTLSFHCSNDSYELVGDPDITCLRTGLWSARRPLCRPLNSTYCELPDPIPHTQLSGIKKGDYFEPGETVEVLCERGYRLEGNDTVECGERGMWTKEFGVCKEVFCERPPSIENGTITKVTDTNRTTFPYGSNIYYVCNQGYRVEVGAAWRTCAGTGVWSGKNPSCEAIHCPDPGTPDYAIKDSSDYSVGSRVHFSCYAGYDMLGSGELLCQSNGQWAGEPTRCDHPDNFCPDPGTPIKGSKNVSKYRMGAKVRFYCDRGTIMHGSKVRECLPDRTWSGTPTKCIGLYDFENADQLKQALVKKFGDIKERELMEQLMYDGTYIIARNFLYFAFDVSDSIPKDTFAKSIDIAKAIVRLMGVSPDGTRVGAITFASNVTRIFPPLKYETMEDVLAALDAIEHTGGSTSVSSAFSYIRKEYMVEVKKRLRLAEIKSTIFIFTDGHYNTGGNPKGRANPLKSKGVDIFSIGITGNPKTEVLYDIASTDQQTQKPYVFMLQNYGIISWLVHDIAYGKASYSQCGLGEENVGVASSRIPVDQPVIEPWMAALYLTKSKGGVNKFLQCGGSIIHRHFILTAAHCMYFNSSDITREPSDITVKLGLVHEMDTEYMQELEVRKIHIHDNYSHPILDYNAALLELKGSIEYNSRVVPICLPPKDIPEDSPFYKSQSKMWTAGWGGVSMGRRDDRHPYTKNLTLKKVLLEIEQPEKCPEMLGEKHMFFTDRMFCAGTRGAMNNTCQAGRGGPVMQQRLNEVGYVSWTQVGIVSWDVGCGKTKEYGMYQHLRQLMPWIEEVIQKTEKPIE